jgi:hypothetical protein
MYFMAVVSYGDSFWGSFHPHFAELLAHAGEPATLCRLCPRMVNVGSKTSILLPYD